MLGRIAVAAVIFIWGARGSASAVTGAPICPACDQDCIKDPGMVGGCVEYNVTMLHRLVSVTEQAVWCG